MTWPFVPWDTQDQSQIVSEFRALAKAYADQAPAPFQMWVDRSHIDRLGVSVEAASAAALNMGLQLRVMGESFEAMTQAWRRLSLDRGIELLERAGVRPPLQGDARAELWARVLDPHRTRPR